MDTHIDGADPKHAGIGLAAPLELPNGSVPRDFGRTPPGVPRGDAAASAAEPIGPPVSVAKRPRRGRKVLLAGVALVAILGVAGTAYVFQDAIRARDPRLVSRHHIHFPHALSSVLARVKASSSSPALEAGAQPARKTDRTAPVAAGSPSSTTAAASRTRTLAAEFDAFKPGEPGVAPQAVQPSTPAAQAAGAESPAPAPRVAEAGLPMPGAHPAASAPAHPVETASVTPPSPTAVTPTPTAAAPPPAAPALSVTAPVATPAPSPEKPLDAVATALELRPAPMSPPKLINMLDLVRSIATQLKDTRIEVAQLHQTVNQLSHKLDSKITDFDTRLTMTEAAKAVEASAQAGRTLPDDAAEAAKPAPASTPSPGARPAGRTTETVTPAAARVVVPAPERRTVKDYVVKGASPGLAVLSALNPVSGTPSAIEVGVGDVVPGLGKVKRVYQHGTTWVVETDGGSIQP